MMFMRMWQIIYKLMQCDLFSVVLTLTLFLNIHLPSWTRAATLHSPFLAIFLLLGASTLLGRIWHCYHGDVSVTLFHLLMRTVSEVVRYSFGFII